MAPNIGQGANTAIEDAAVLSSLINRLVNVDGIQQPSLTCINEMLQKYKNLRFERVRGTCDRAKFGARFHTRDDRLKALIGRYFLPCAGILVENRTHKILAQGSVIEFLPIPERSWTGPPMANLQTQLQKLEPFSSFLLLLLICACIGFAYTYVLVL